MMTKQARTQGNALDLLEGEDVELRRLFRALRLRRGSSVEERAEYGGLAKETIRRLATREAGLVDVAKAGSADPNLREIANRIERNSRNNTRSSAPLGI